MTTKLAAALAAAALAVGILVGAAGSVLVHDATRPTIDMAGMAGMHQVMGGTTGPMMDGPMGPGASMDPALHRAHHGGDR